MNKRDIQTRKADLNLVSKFLDYANCADASYALLDTVNGEFEDIIKGKKENVKGDKQKLGSTTISNNKEVLSTYARTIEVRFQKDKKVNLNTERINDGCK